ncbi:MAG: hypothetical protein M3522_07305 [Actinomycetota bacterium]|nr:hypothetical protein [Actinomycetota bacterium]
MAREVTDLGVRVVALYLREWSDGGDTAVAYQESAVAYRRGGEGKDEAGGEYPGPR